MNEPTGFYHCKKCKINIRVETLSKHCMKYYPYKINKCPSCFGKLENITKNRFEDQESKLFIRVKRKYPSHQKKGEMKTINLGLKYL